METSKKLNDREPQQQGTMLHLFPQDIVTIMYIMRTTSIEYSLEELKAHLRTRKDLYHYCDLLHRLENPKPLNS